MASVSIANRPVKSGRLCKHLFIAFEIPRFIYKSQSTLEIFILCGKILDLNIKSTLNTLIIFIFILRHTLSLFMFMIEKKLKLFFRH
jgi:hypothetical protein